MKRRSVDTSALLCLTALVTLVLFFLLKVPLDRLDVPFTFLGDAIDKLTQIKTVAETGWLYHNDRLGFPFGYDRLDFPRFDTLNYAVMGPIAALTGQAGLAMNLYFILGFYLIAFAAFFTFRRLGMQSFVALICAIIFAFLPYHLTRGVGHLTNGTYYLIPFALLITIRLAEGQVGPETVESRRRWFWALIVAVLLPLQTPYNGVFFAFLCLVAGAVALAGRWRWRTVIVTLSFLIITASTFMIEQIPVRIYAAEKGSAVTVGRSPLEAEIYSMRLNQVFLPTDQHRVRKLRVISQTFNDVMHVPETEIRNQYVGILGIAGLAALMWAILRSIRRPEANVGNLEGAARIAGILALAIVLFAISSGIGTMVAFFLTEHIRAYNRILPFLAFTSLIGGGWLLQTMLTSLGQTTRRSVAVVVGALLVFDITPLSSYGSRDDMIADYDQSKAYFQKMESSLGDNATVFQLPAIWYPEHPTVNRMLDYDYLKPYLLTETLRFSSGGSHYREGYKWSRAVERLAPPDIIAQTHAKGFVAILIDGYAYEPDEFVKITAAFAALTVAPPVVSDDKRWWAFDLKSCCDGSVEPKDIGYPDAIQYTVGSAPLKFDAASGNELDGWYNPEDWGAWAQDDANLHLYLSDVPSEPLDLAVDVQVMIGPMVPERRLTIECNGKLCGTYVFNPENPAQLLKVALPNGTVSVNGQLNIRFIVEPRASPKDAGINEDARSLGVGLKQLTIALRSGNLPAKRDSGQRP